MNLISLKNSFQNKEEIKGQNNTTKSEAECFGIKKGMLTMSV
jgi:hypothetical protein